VHEVELGLFPATCMFFRYRPSPGKRGNEREREGERERERETESSASMASGFQYSHVLVPLSTLEAEDSSMTHRPAISRLC